jgi:F1F0 ATPase subunit 2
MSDAGYYVLSLLAGAALGVVFFGGLWLTIQKLRDARHQALLLVGSYFGRSAITLAGFYVIAGGRLERLLVAVLGFVLVRIVMSWWVRSQTSPEEEVKARAVES